MEAPYGEAIIILSAAISTLAAEVWPGEEIDKARFVEMFEQDYCDPGRIQLELAFHY